MVIKIYTTPTCPWCKKTKEFFKENIAESNPSASLIVTLNIPFSFVFIEVKLKIGDQYGTPEEMISKGKISRVKRIAEGFAG